MRRANAESAPAEFRQQPRQRTVAEQFNAVIERINGEGIIGFAKFEADVLDVHDDAGRAQYTPRTLWDAYVAWKDETQLNVDGSVVVGAVVDEATPADWVDDTDAHAAMADVMADDVPPIRCTACDGPLNPMDSDGICTPCRRQQEAAAQAREDEANNIVPPSIPQEQAGLLPE